jgi:hypothetical protein
MKLFQPEDWVKRKLMLSEDRRDPSRSIVRKLLAFAVAGKLLAAAKSRGMSNPAILQGVDEPSAKSFAPPTLYQITTRSPGGR